jgi:fumarate reductase subunit C
VRAQAADEVRIRTYRQPMPATWWLRNRRYLLYMARDFSPLPFSLWLIWFLVEINNLKAGPSGYHAHLSPAFVVFSAICFLFALLHSVTFLNLSGVILRIPVGERVVSPALVRAANFGIWIVASVVIAAGLVFLATR